MKMIMVVMVMIEVVIMINMAIFEESTVLNIVCWIGTLNATWPRWRNKACNLFGQRLIHIHVAVDGVEQVCITTVSENAWLDTNKTCNSPFALDHPV